jgi:N-acetylglutamate synthase
MTPRLVFTTTVSTRAKGSAVSASEPSSGDARWPEPAWIMTALGRRVSVRSAAGVPGPTGGPGFRDVVGFLESVQPGGNWVIRTRTGKAVMVDPTAVVAAKIVPDAPARLRSASEIDVASLERIAAQAWQPLESETLGNWMLRAAAGFTGRANSVLPLGDPGLPLDDALAAVGQWYAERSLPATIQLPLPLHADLDAALADRRWQRHGAVAVLACDLDPLRMAAHQAPEPTTPATVDITAAPDQAWLATFRYGDTPVPVVAVPMMTNTDQPLFVSARGPTGDTLGIARGAITRRWLGITAVEVVPGSRRQGLGRQLIAALAEEAARHGCRHVWLQVAHDNPGARALYDQLGFVAHHDYVYRQQP